MKRFLFKLLPITGMLITWGTAHAVICNISATSMPLSTVYSAPAATQTYIGTISGSCTPEALEVGTRPYIYIGINEGNPPAGRAMVRQNGANLLNYQIYRDVGLTNIWNEAAAANNGAGGVSYRMATGVANTAQAIGPYSYYLNIPAGQTTNPAGIYNDSAITATIRLSTNGGIATGAVINTAVFSANASIQHSCYFSTKPSTLNLNYTSFTGTAVTGASSFALSCTFNSPYTLVLAPTTGTALGVNYSLALSAASGTGTAAPQNFTVTGTAAAGQAGTCASSTCSVTNPHTITVTF